MSARERIPNPTRTAIEADIRAGVLSCRAIARHYNISPGSVRNIAKAANITDAFTRSNTKAATAARVADCAARRARLAERALDLAERMLDRATEPYTLIVTTKDEVFREVLPEPPANDVKAFATSYGIYSDKHMALTRFDTHEVANVAAASLVDRLVEQLGLDQAAGDYDDGYPAELPADVAP